MVQGFLCVSGFNHTENRNVTLDSLQSVLISALIKQEEVSFFSVCRDVRG